MSRFDDDPPDPPPGAVPPRSDGDAPLRARSGALTEATSRPTARDLAAEARRRQRIMAAVALVTALVIVAFVVLVGAYD